MERWQRVLSMGLLLLLLALPCLPRAKGDGGVDATAVADGIPRRVIVPIPTPESRLRADIAGRKAVIKLTEDVSLTRDLGEVYDLTLVGSCRTRSGRPRRCRIDAQKRFSGFIFVGGTSLTLDNIELTGFVGGTGNRSSFIVGGSGTVRVRRCLITRSGNPAGAGGPRALIDLAGSNLSLSKTQFVANNGALINVWYSSFHAADVIFRSNRDGPLIDHVRADLTFVRCGFENNTGKEAVMETKYGTVLFSRSWFSGNSLTEVGARGAAVVFQGPGSTKFCNCRFSANTIAVGNGRTREEHVYVKLADSVEVAFCEKRPSTGVALGPGVPRSAVVDSCDGCPR